jgi:hypothetical protein
MFPSSDIDIRMLKTIKGHKIEKMVGYYGGQESSWEVTGIELFFSNETSVLLGKKSEITNICKTPWPVKSFEAADERSSNRVMYLLIGDGCRDFYLRNPIEGNFYGS